MITSMFLSLRTIFDSRVGQCRCAHLWVLYVLDQLGKHSLGFLLSGSPQRIWAASSTLHHMTCVEVVFASVVYQVQQRVWPRLPEGRGIGHICGWAFFFEYLAADTLKCGSAPGRFAAEGGGDVVPPSFAFVCWWGRPPCTPHTQSLVACPVGPPGVSVSFRV